MDEGFFGLGRKQNPSYTVEEFKDIMKRAFSTRGAFQYYTFGGPLWVAAGLSGLLGLERFPDNSMTGKFGDRWKPVIEAARGMVDEIALSLVSSPERANNMRSSEILKRLEKLDDYVSVLRSAQGMMDKTNSHETKTFSKEVGSWLKGIESRLGDGGELGEAVFSGGPGGAQPGAIGSMTAMGKGGKRSKKPSLTVDELYQQALEKGIPKGDYLAAYKKLGGNLRLLHQWVDTYMVTGG